MKSYSALGEPLSQFSVMAFLALFTALLCLPFAACGGLPTNEGIAAAIENELAPLTITLVNQTGNDIRKVRVCHSHQSVCIQVLGTMSADYTKNVATAGPLPLGVAYVEWINEDDTPQIQQIYIVITNPVYILRRPD